MTADPTMRTHCDDCDRPDLCDIIKRGTAPCRQNAGMGPAAADLLADFRAEVDRLRAERDSTPRPMSDPTPAAPDQAEGPQPPPFYCMAGPRCETQCTVCSYAQLLAPQDVPNSHPTPNNSQIRSWDPSHREIL